MANNPTADEVMLEAATAAYAIVERSDGTLTLSGSDPSGVAYGVDANGVISNGALAGYTLGAAFINNDTGFKAVALISPLNEQIIAFAGTENLQDGGADVQLGWNQWVGKRPDGSPGKGGQNVLDYIRAHASNPIYITGHSLGGGLAEYAAYFAKQEEKKRQETDPAFHINISLTTFNAMGVLDSIALHVNEAASQSAASILMQGTYVAHYYRQGDLVSRLGGGHVGGTGNVYKLGTDTLDFLTAHLTSALYQSDLSAATLDSPAYLNLTESQRVAAEIIHAATQRTQAPLSDLQLIAALDRALRQTVPEEMNKLATTALLNLYDAGVLTPRFYEKYSAILWGEEFKQRGLLGPVDDFILATRSASLATATDKVIDTLVALKNWASDTAGQVIDSVIEDVESFLRTIETYILPTHRGVSVTEELSLWLQEGYDVPTILDAAEQIAAQIQQNPASLDSQLEANPLSFLPPLTAPLATDYAADPAGQTAYQAALTLYNQKRTERTQVETLYNQYQTDTQALTGLTYHGSPYSQTGNQTVIQGDSAGNPMNDILWADPVTQQIFGLAGNDRIDARHVTGLRAYGGSGNDALQGGDFYTGLYYGDNANFLATYGRVKPGTGVFLYGDAGNDRLLGSLRNDTLDGGSEHDYSNGYLGDDRLLGGSGNDALNGDEGRDTLEGNNDHDRLAGGAGADYLQGGTGNDRLYGDSRLAYLTWDGIDGTLVYGTTGSGSYAVIKDVAESGAGDDVRQAA
jgi:Ca2+-binding RTX toxin-like protein